MGFKSPTLHVEYIELGIVIGYSMPFMCLLGVTTAGIFRGRRKRGEASETHQLG